MIYSTGDSFNISFATHDDTGAAADADSTPSGTLRRNGSDTAESVTVTNNATGDYTASGTIPAGWSNGDEVEIVLSATVGGVTGKMVVSLGKLDATISSRAAANRQERHEQTSADAGNKRTEVDITDIS